MGRAAPAVPRNSLVVAVALVAVAVELALGSVLVTKVADNMLRYASSMAAKSGPSSELSLLESSPSVFSSASSSSSTAGVGVSR